MKTKDMADLTLAGGQAPCWLGESEIRREREDSGGIPDKAQLCPASGRLEEKGGPPKRQENWRKVPSALLSVLREPAGRSMLARVPRWRGL